jgi:hypothetical protein
MLIFLLRVSHTRSATKDMLIKRVDFTGNAVYVAAVLAVMFALVYGTSSTRGHHGVFLCQEGATLSSLPSCRILPAVA